MIFNAEDIVYTKEDLDRLRLRLQWFKNVKKDDFVSWLNKKGINECDVIFSDLICYIYEKHDSKNRIIQRKVNNSFELRAFMFRKRRYNKCHVVFSGGYNFNKRLKAVNNEFD